MRWKPKDERQWHRWFAWFPVYVDRGDTKIWLEMVERRYIGCGQYHHRRSAPF